MRILVACDTFKESCSAPDACEAIARGLRRHHSSWDIDVCPLADGGEGTIASIAMSIALDLEPVQVKGPLGEPVEAELAWIEGALPAGLIEGSDAPGAAPGRVAIIEAASCLGLGLVPERRRNPLMTSSYGLGQLLALAQQRGAGWVIVGLGGTSTVDVGIGMAQALGATIPGIREPAGGGALAHVSLVDVSGIARRNFGLRVLAACDVRNPLLGARGAARAFAPQKGASPQVVEYLEQGAAHFAHQLFEVCEGARANSGASRAPPLGDPSLLSAARVARSLGFEEAVSQAGAGAAGGLGFALRQLLCATLINGVDWVMRCVNFDERLARADWVVTGEGKLDESSFEGKVVSGVVERAAKKGIPIAAICGQNALSTQECATRGLSHVETLVDLARDESDAKARATELLADAGGRLASRLESIACREDPARRHDTNHEKD